MWTPLPTPPPLPKYEGCDPRPYRHIAPHIRGRVFLMRSPHGQRHALWGMEVIDQNTGQVIASDNCTIRESLFDLAEEVTAAARAAWFWSFKPKDVK